MGSKPRFTRRSVFTAGAGAVAGAAAGGAIPVPAATRGGGGSGVITAESLGTVRAIRPDGTLEVARTPGSRAVDHEDPEALARDAGPVVHGQPDSLTVVVANPGRDGLEAGSEVVLVEQLHGADWVVTDVERLYRPIHDSTVTARRGETLSTPSGDLRVTRASDARSDHLDHEAVPLASVRPGDTVEGIGYRDGDSDALTVAQLGVRRRRR